MRERRSAGLLVLLTIGLAGPAAAEPAEWTPGRRGDGNGYAYQTFSKQSEGENHVRYQARGTIRAAPDALVRAVRAISVDPARAPDGQTRRLVSQRDDQFIVYTHIDLPPLFSDRDIVTRGISSADPRSGVHRINWRAIDHPDAPRIDGVIRIERSEGYWVFAPIGPAGSHVTYETFVDLGGSLPRWLVSGMMGGTVADTYEDLAREALGR